MEKYKILKDGSLNPSLVLKETTQEIIVDRFFDNDITNSQGNYEKGPSLKIDVETLAQCKLGIYYDRVKKNIKSVNEFINHSYNHQSAELLRTVSELLINHFIAAIDGDKYKANLDKEIRDTVELTSKKIMN